MTFFFDCLLQTPSSEEDWVKIATEYENHWNFPNCRGAMDGKHILLKQPRKSHLEKFYLPLSTLIINLRTLTLTLKWEDKQWWSIP